MHDLLIINWEKSSENMRPTLFVGWGEGQGMCELENAPEIQKYPNFCPWLLFAFIFLTMHSFSVKNQWIGTMTVCSLQWTCNDSGRK